VISNHEVKGFSANHNQVLRQVETEYVLVLNPDVKLTPSALISMRDYMEANPHAAAVGPAIADQTGSVAKPILQAQSLKRDLFLLPFYISLAQPGQLERWYRFFAGFRLAGTRVRALLGKHQPRRQRPISDQSDLQAEKIENVRENAIEVEAIHGACMFLRTDALCAVGAFDEQFFLYWEEVDWCLRARRAGWRIGYLPNTLVYHDGASSTRPHYLKYLAIYVDSTLKFYRKHGTTVSLLILRTWLFLVNLVNLSRWSLGRLPRPSDPSLQERIDFACGLVQVFWRG
jgi:GT2 family glycosyltransferase